MCQKQLQNYCKQCRGEEKKYDARFAAGIILMRNIYMYVRINKLCFIYLACSLQ